MINLNEITRPIEWSDLQLTSFLRKNTSYSLRGTENETKICKEYEKYKLLLLLLISVRIYFILISLKMKHFFKTESHNIMGNGVLVRPKDRYTFVLTLVFQLSFVKTATTWVLSI